MDTSGEEGQELLSWLLLSTLAVPLVPGLKEMPHQQVADMFGAERVFKKISSLRLIRFPKANTL